MRVFEGNRSDPTTVGEQIQILQEQFGVEELVFVGDRGMVKSKGKQALTGAGLRYITALTDPQIRRLLAQGTLQLSLFSEQVCEVQGEGVRYILCRNPDEAQREQHRLDAANLEWPDQPATAVRTTPAASRKRPTAINLSGADEGFRAIPLEGTQLKLQQNEEAIARALELASCYVVTTDVASSAAHGGL